MKYAFLKIFLRSRSLPTVFSLKKWTKRKISFSYFTFRNYTDGTDRVYKEEASRLVKHIEHKHGKHHRTSSSSSDFTIEIISHSLYCMAMFLRRTIESPVNQSRLYFFGALAGASVYSMVTRSDAVLAPENGLTDTHNVVCKREGKY